MTSCYKKPWGRLQRSDERPPVFGFGAQTSPMAQKGQYPAQDFLHPPTKIHNRSRRRPQIETDFFHCSPHERLIAVCDHIMPVNTH